MIRQRYELLLKASLLLLLHHGLPAYALSTDKDQPIEVEANAAELDDIKNVSVYTGDVVVNQGTIKMTGDVMTVYHTDDDELDYMIMEGNPATYKQLPDNSSVYDQARALRMEYYELKNMVILVREAWVKQETSTLTGERIEYNTELSQVKAWNNPERGKSSDQSGSNQKSRVKLVIKKKKKSVCEDLNTPENLDPEELAKLRKDCPVDASGPGAKE